MDEMKKYELWCEKATEDEDLVAELKSISGDQDAIQDRFYRDLEFGTGGLRGVIGAGCNRLNIYTVRKATQGLANFLKASCEKPSIAIAYDSRIKSDVFAKEAACVMAANGVEVHLFSELMPTPTLSFAVRALHTDAGIVITASHNPAKYNGYKVYGSDGCQITLDMANAVLTQIESVEMFGAVQYMNFDTGIHEGLIHLIPDDLLEQYLDKVQEQSVNPGLCESVGLKVVYTPLNGTGNKPVRKILDRIGINQVFVVKEQEMPDGNFPTVPFPNPEIEQAFECALKLANETEPDLLLATDPDCDRVGIAVLSDGEYKLMSGNEVGCMLLDYVLSQRIAHKTIPENPVAVTTIVSTVMAHSIAKKYGCELFEVLTGFKFIGEQIGFLEAKGEENRYVFGFEESYGYLAGSYVRDKDGVVASMLICEMAAFYKKQGLSLYDVMQKLYEEHGVYSHALLSFTCEGASGMEQMRQIMCDLRENSPVQIGGIKVVEVADYQASIRTSCELGEQSVIDLPKSNVLSYSLDDGNKVIVRPSGTEPKIKVYITARGNNKKDAEIISKSLQKDVTAILGF